MFTILILCLIKVQEPKLQTALSMNAKRFVATSLDLPLFLSLLFHLKH